jgi:hypothetical protein
MRVERNKIFVGGPIGIDGGVQTSEADFPFSMIVVGCIGNEILACEIRPTILAFQSFERKKNDNRNFFSWVSLDFEGQSFREGYL